MGVERSPHTGLPKPPVASAGGPFEINQEVTWYLQWDIMSEAASKVIPSTKNPGLRVYPGIAIRSSEDDIGATLTSDQATVRAANLSLVLTEIFSCGGGLSRADIAARTGLTRATSSRLVANLLSAGVIEEGTPSAEMRMGRPSTPLFPSVGRIVGIGLEVNVDHLAGVAVDLSGQILAQFVDRGDYAGSDPAETLRTLGESARAMCEQLREDGVVEIGAATIGVPGLVDSLVGEVIYAPNLGWEAVRPADHLRKYFPAGTMLQCMNDADLQAVAAANALAQNGDQPDSFLYISGDAGVGGAIVFNGVMLAGARGWAGEIGHTTVSPEGPLCHCGAFGCLETYAGWRAIAANADFDWREGAEGMVEQLKAGDEAAQRAVDVAVRALALAVSNAAKLLDVQTVVLGTGLALLLPWMQHSLSSEIEARKFPPGSKGIQFVAAPIQGMPTVVGAALRALQFRLSEPEMRGGVLEG